ncbi:MAG: hypothetical protein Kow0096_16010 [Thiohalomonadaceae bacterium]
MDLFRPSLVAREQDLRERAAFRERFRCLLAETRRMQDNGGEGGLVNDNLGISTQ